MAPLSRFLSGVFLKHDTYGTHLDGSGKTIDIDLEIRNFFAIMGVVSEIWSEKFIDKCPVHCIPVDIGCKFTPDEPDPIWVANHVIQGRYMKQIVKCHISTCCAPFKTNWCKVFPTRFIPPPVPVQFGPRGLEVIEVSEYKERLKLETNFKAKKRYTAHIAPLAEDQVKLKKKFLAPMCKLVKVGLK